METSPLSSNVVVFDCQLYVSRHGLMELKMPVEDGPIKVARFRPLAYDELADPGFRKLLAAFESVPGSLKSVQV